MISDNARQVLCAIGNHIADRPDTYTNMEDLMVHTGLHAPAIIEAIRELATSDPVLLGKATGDTIAFRLTPAGWDYHLRNCPLTPMDD